MEDKVTVKQVGLKYGLILGLIFIVYGMILQFLNLDVQLMQNLGNVNYVIMVVFVVLAHKTFKQEGDGFMSLGQGIGLGMLTTLISSVISGVFSYIYLKFIDDSMIQKSLDFQIEQMEKRGMGDDQIDAAMSMTEKFMTPEILPIISIVFLCLAGFVISLIVSLITKKNNPALDV